MPQEARRSMRSVEERNTLAESGARLIHLVIRQMAPWRIERVGGRQDAFQIGYMGLLRAAELFDETLGYQFSTYAVPAIRRALLSASHWCANPVCQSLDSLCEVEEDVIELADVAPTVQETTARREQHAYAHQLLASLKEEGQDLEMVARGYYLEGKTLRTLGHDMGTSATHAGIVHRQALECLRDAAIVLSRKT